MKTPVLSLLLILFILNCYGQFVTISDANFAGYISYTYHNCINGNQLDTTCPDILNATSIDLVNWDVTDITGIRFFKSLKYLSLNYNHFIHTVSELPDSLETLHLEGNYFLSALPATLPPGLKRIFIDHSPCGLLAPLPNSLITISCNYTSSFLLPVLPPALDSLMCNGNSLASIPALPTTLHYLDCSVNSITALPALPSNLIYLNCGFNPVSALPTLPNTLKFLDCSNTQQSLTVIPPFLEELYCHYAQINTLLPLPSTLKVLGCIHNNLNQLPALPNGLQKLICSENQLASLPILPDSLRILICDVNPLGQLTALPDSLEELSCCVDQLSSLPVLPPALKTLKCSSNQLSVLPSIPGSLITLNCNVNHLTSLPNLPMGLINLNCAYNQLTGLPFMNHRMQTFKINNNPNIKCLPYIDSLVTFFSDSINLSNTGIRCLVSPIYYYTGQAIPLLDTLPLCSVYNPDSCSISIGINEINSIAPNVFPNPSSGKINLSVSDHSNLTCKLTDVSGRNVYEKQLYNFQGHSLEIDLSAISSGIYLLFLSDGNKIYSQKIIKQ